jgi:ABC-type sugar transport system substrate-binding protein
MRGRTAFAVIGACLAVLASSSMAVAAPRTVPSTPPADPGAAAAAAAERVAPLLEVPDVITVTEPLASPPEPGVSVYWVTPNLQSQQPNTDALETATDMLGWELTTIQTDSADPQAVPSGIEQAVSGGADYIIVSGGSIPIYGEALASAQQAGIPIIDMYSSDEVGGESNGIYANIGGTAWIQEQYPAGVDVITADSGGDAHVLYVDIPDFPILAAAAEATHAQFEAACPDCVVTSLDVSVADLLGGAVASQVISALQRDESIDYVYTSFGDLATGLPESLAAADLADRVALVTAAPNPEQVQGVIDGTVLAVLPNPKPQGSFTAIDAIARLEQGLEVDEREHSVMPVIIWTTDNVPDPMEEFAGAQNYEEQFAELWLVS